MDNMKDIREISDEQAVILWQASRLSLSGKYEKAPEILSVQGSVIGTLGNFIAGPMTGTTRPVSSWPGGNIRRSNA